MEQQKRTAIIVLGMHRTGTSALTRVLNLLGAELGSDLLAAQPDNETGIWEHRPIMEIHERILGALDSDWHDVRPLPVVGQGPPRC